MSSIIAKLMDRLFPKKEVRILVLGVNSPGRTTALYQMKLGEVVTTIPTIGFNVETIEQSKMSATLWDVGGRDKIRPLWRHYFQNTAAIIFMVDSGRYAFEISEEEYRDELFKFLAEDELRDIVLLVWANKRDAHDAMPLAEMRDRLKIDQIRSHTVNLLGCTATTGEGLDEGMTWIREALAHSRSNRAPAASPAAATKANQVIAKKTEVLATKLESSPPSPSPLVPPKRPTPSSGQESFPSDSLEREVFTLEPPTSMPEREVFTSMPPTSTLVSRQETFLLDCLEQKDEAAVVAGFLEGKIPAAMWSHRERLLVCWTLLRDHGRLDGMQRVFDGVKNILAESGSFHHTTLYFWCHMIHYASAATANPLGDFKGFLLSNPQLANVDLILDFYTQEMIWQNPAAKDGAVLPDKQSLPSMITPVQSAAPSGAVAQLKRPEQLDDEDFLELFEQQRLPSWGHETKLRAIWAMLRWSGRRGGGGTEKLLTALQGMERSGYHLTRAYFWVQMVTYYDALVRTQGSEITTFQMFINRKECKPLLNPDLPEVYYSVQVLEQGASEFAVPDKKQFPNLARK